MMLNLRTLAQTLTAQAGSEEMRTLPGASKSCWKRPLKPETSSISIVFLLKFEFFDGFPSVLRPQVARVGLQAPGACFAALLLRVPLDGAPGLGDGPRGLRAAGGGALRDGRGAGEAPGEARERWQRVLLVGKAQRGEGRGEEEEGQEGGGVDALEAAGGLRFFCFWLDLRPISRAFLSSFAESSWIFSSFCAEFLGDSWISPRCPHENRGRSVDFKPRLFVRGS